MAISIMTILIDDVIMRKSVSMLEKVVLETLHDNICKPEDLPVRRSGGGIDGFSQI